METLTVGPDGSIRSILSFIWEMWRAFPIYVLLRDGTPLLWLLSFLYIAPFSFPLFPGLRAAFRRSLSAAFIYVCFVLAVALLCTGLELVSALRWHFDGSLYEGAEHLAVITLWPASALLFGIVFLLYVGIFRRLMPLTVA